MKIMEVIQTILGLIAILSFISVFLFIFINKDYPAVFIGLFFIFLPLSMYMNRFTRGYKFSAGYHIFLIVLLIMGLVIFYFAMDTLKTKTIYELSLEKLGDEGYLGSFNIPGDVPLGDKDYSFFIDVKYSSTSRGGSSNSDYDLELISPTGSNNLSFFISSGSSKGTKYTESIIKSDYRFTSSPGNYTIRVTPSNKNLQIIVRSIKILIRTER